MELNHLNNYKKGFELTKTILLGLFLFFAVTVLGIYFFAQQEIKKAQNSMLVINLKNGQMFDSEKQSIQDMRVYQYELQAKLVYNLWYSFDENNYDSNIESALYLLGDCGKEMMNSYLDEDVKSLVSQKSIVFRVKINKVNIDMNSNPVRGIIEGVQTIKRPSGELSRNLHCSFTISDCNSSSKNQLGCKIDNWEIYNKERLN